jgi:hypothetical protein
VTEERGRNRSVVVGAGVLVLALVLVVYLTSRATPAAPFGIGSSAPGGYRALALLIESTGSRVDSVPFAEIDPVAPGAEVLVVPLPTRLSAQDRAALADLAAEGATVVFGEPVHDGPDEPASSRWSLVPDRELAETAAQPVDPGGCPLPELDGLGPIDAAFAVPIFVLEADDWCYGDATAAMVTRRVVGEGQIVNLADPLLWSNARLQPAKEAGGEPLDNAAMALRILGAEEGRRILVVEPAVRGVTPDDTARNPLELLPFQVRLALLQAAVALVLYLWWRGRRLGRPMREPLPVRIAASELVAAVGELLRRRGSASRAAASMRADLRRELSSRLGVPAGNIPELVERVAARTGRPVAEVAAIILDPPYGGGSAEVDDLVRLAGALDSIRQEVLDEQLAR